MLLWYLNSFHSCKGNIFSPIFDMKSLHDIEEWELVNTELKKIS